MTSKAGSNMKKAGAINRAIANCSPCCEQQPCTSVINGAGKDTRPDLPEPNSGVFDRPKVGSNSLRTLPDTTDTLDSVSAPTSCNGEQEGTPADSDASVPPSEILSEP